VWDESDGIHGPCCVTGEITGIAPEAKAPIGVVVFGLRVRAGGPEGDGVGDVGAVVVGDGGDGGTEFSLCGADALLDARGGLKDDDADGLIGVLDDGIDVAVGADAWEVEGPGCGEDLVVDPDRMGEEGGDLMQEAAVVAVRGLPGALPAADHRMMEGSQVQRESAAEQSRPGWDAFNG